MLIEGTSQGEVLVGTRNDDLVFGNGGEDDITTKGGDDTIVARGLIYAQGGRDQFFSVDFFRVFDEPRNNTVTSPRMGAGRDLIVVDGHDELFGGAGVQKFSQVDLGGGRDKLVIGSADGAEFILGRGADTAWIVGNSYIDLYLGSKEGLPARPVSDGDVDEVHYNAGSDGLLMRAFGQEDILTIYNSGLTYASAIARSETLGNDHVITLPGGAKVTIQKSFSGFLDQSQLRFVDDPYTIRQTVYVAGEDVAEVAKFGSSADDVLRISNGALFLGEGDDIGRGSDAIERLHGQDGNDKLIGFGGNDILRGGTGHDLIVAGDGNDRLVTGAGRDTLYAGSGDDVLICNGVGEEGGSILKGGRGSDVFVFRGGTGDAGNPMVVSMGGGRDQINFEKDVGLVVLEDYNRRDTLVLDLISGQNNPEYSVESMVQDQKDSETVYPALAWKGTLLTLGNLQLLFEGYAVGAIREDDFVF